MNTDAVKDESKNINRLNEEMWNRLVWIERRSFSLQNTNMFCDMLCIFFNSHIDSFEGEEEDDER